MEIRPRKAYHPPLPQLTSFMPPYGRQSALRYPLTQILGGNANIRALRELFRHGGELAAPSIVSRTGLAKASVRHSLGQLQDLKIVESVGFRRTRLFKIRREHPFFDLLSLLFQAERDRFENIIKAIGEASDQFGGVLAVWLYGSVSRGEDQPNSDIDVAVAVRWGDVTEIERSFKVKLANSEEKLDFAASLVVIDANDILRLSGEDDPWWTSLVEDALVIRGERPASAASRLRRSPDLQSADAP